jgi:riboflavin transporter FmnP
MRANIQASAQPSRTKLLVRIGVLAALAFVLMMLEINLPPFPAFLQYDAGEVPALLGGFAMGPGAGAAIVTGKCLIFLLSGKDEAGFIGTAANFVSAFPLVVVAAWIYSRVKSRAGAVLGMAAGLVATVIATSVGNYFIFLPLWGVPGPALWPMIYGTLIPFNAVKVLLTSAITLLLYKRVRDWLH